MKSNRLATLFLALALASATYASGPFKGSSIEIGGRLGLGAILPSGEAMDNLGLDVDLLYDPGFARGFDLHYTYMANPFFGFTTGVSVLFLNSTVSAKDVVSTYTGVMELEAPLYTSTVHCVGTTTLIKEQYQTAFIEVPILLAIHNGNWYYDLGFRLAMPLRMKADYTYGESIMYVDYVDRTGVDLSSNPLPQPNEPGGKGSYDILSNRARSLFVLWSMEIGYNINISDNTSLSIGAFLDYGLNDASLDNNKTAELLTLNGSNIEKYNGAINSNMMDNIRYYTAGVRLLFNIGFGDGVGGGSTKNKRLL